VKLIKKLLIYIRNSLLQSQLDFDFDIIYLLVVLLSNNLYRIIYLKMSRSKKKKSNQIYTCCVKKCGSLKLQWGSINSMYNHINGHLLGLHEGTVPKNFFTDHRKMQCNICSKLVSTSHKVHPKCRRKSNRKEPVCSEPQSVPSSQESGKSHINSITLLDFPEWNEIIQTKAYTIPYIPRAARKGWAKLFSGLIKDVMFHCSSV